MSNNALSFEKDGSDGLTHNVQRGRKGTQNEIGRVLGYQGQFLGRLPGDHFMAVQLVGCAQGITMKGCIFSNQTSKEKRYQIVKKIRHPYHDAIQSS